MQIIGIILALLSTACTKLICCQIHLRNFWGTLFLTGLYPEYNFLGVGQAGVVLRASSILAPDRTLVLHLVLLPLDQYLHQFRRLKWLYLLWPLH